MYETQGCFEGLPFYGKSESNIKIYYDSDSHRYIVGTNFITSIPLDITQQYVSCQSNNISNCINSWEIANTNLLGWREINNVSFASFACDYRLSLISDGAKGYVCL